MFVIEWLGRPWDGHPIVDIGEAIGCEGCISGVYDEPMAASTPALGMSMDDARCVYILGAGVVFGLLIFLMRK